MLFGLERRTRKAGPRRSLTCLCAHLQDALVLPLLPEFLALIRDCGFTLDATAENVLSSTAVYAALCKSGKLRAFCDLVSQFTTGSGKAKRPLQTGDEFKHSGTGYHFIQIRGEAHKRLFEFLQYLVVKGTGCGTDETSGVPEPKVKTGFKGFEFNGEPYFKGEADKTKDIGDNFANFKPYKVTGLVLPPGLVSLSDKCYQYEEPSADDYKWAREMLALIHAIGAALGSTLTLGDGTAMKLSNALVILHTDTERASMLGPIIEEGERRAIEAALKSVDSASKNEVTDALTLLQMPWVETHSSRADEVKVAIDAANAKLSTMQVRLSFCALSASTHRPLCSYSGRQAAADRQHLAEWVVYGQWRCWELQRRWSDDGVACIIRIGSGTTGWVCLPRPVRPAGGRWCW